MKKKRAGLQHGDLYVLSKPLDGGIPSISFDLTRNEFELIGRGIVGWAHLEHAIYERTRLLAKRARIPIPADATHPRLKYRLKALEETVKAVVKRQIVKDYYLKVCGAISKHSKTRHHLAHDLWSYNPKKPEQLWATKGKSGGGRSEPITEKKLYEFDRVVGQLALLLLYPPGHDRFQKIDDGPFAFVSRSFLLGPKRTDR